MLTVGIEVFAPGMKIVTCLYHGFELAIASTKYEHFEGGYVVKQKTHAHNTPQFFFWQVFIEHGEVIAEVEVRLAWVALGQCASTIMEGRTLGYASHFSTHKVEAPTKVYLFVVGKETTIESASLPIVFTPDKQAGTCCPEHVEGFVILSTVFLYSFKNSASTIGITVSVDISSRGASILETGGGDIAEQLGLASGNVLMLLHILKHGCKPAFSDSNIAIQEKVIFWQGLALLLVLLVENFKGFVVALSKSPVLV